MLKKIMKAALAASLVFGMSSFAYAKDGISVGGKFQEYFGQYDKGSDESTTKSAYTAHSAVLGEVNLQVKGTLGKMSVFHEVEAVTTVYGKKNDHFNAVKSALSYVAPFGKISIGNVVNAGTVPKSSSGWKTSKVPGSTSMYLYISGYWEGPGIDLVVPIEGVGMVQATYYASGGNAATYVGNSTAIQAGATGSGGWAAADLGSGDYARNSGALKGTSMNLGAVLQFGNIGVSASYATTKEADPTAADNTDELSSTSMGLTGKMDLNKQISFSLGYAASSMKDDDWGDDALKITVNDAAVNLGVGPGKVILFACTTAYKMDDKIKDTTATSGMYDYPVAKGAGIQVGYISVATKPEGGDTTTESFVGGGFYAAF